MDNCLRIDIDYYYPAIIKPIPITAGVSGICLYKTAPTIAIQTIPTPDHIAYVIPIVTVLNTSATRYMEINLYFRALKTCDVTIYPPQ